MIALGQHGDAARGEIVLEPEDRELVARNDARGEDHRVALAERNVRMLAGGDARERGARLALAPGAEIEDAVSGQARGVVLGPDAGEIAEVAGVLRRLDHGAHGAADEHDLAAVCARGIGHRFQPRDIGRERGDRDAAGERADQIVQRRLDLRLRAGFAGDERVGGIADAGEHAFLAERAQRRIVGDFAELRIGIDLPVAGVDDGAQGRADRDRVGLRDRMRDGDEGERERAELHFAAERHDVDLHALLEPGFLELVAQEPRGERSRVNRTAQARPEMRDRAEMILVAVREHEAQQARALFLEEPHVGHHQVDARCRGFAAEQHAAIDDDPGARIGRAVAVAVQIHADLARTA